MTKKGSGNCIVLESWYEETDWIQEKKKLWTVDIPHNDLQKEAYKKRRTYKFHSTLQTTHLVVLPLAKIHEEHWKKINKHVSLESFVGMTSDPEDSRNFHAKT
jgi:hypothetical protein